VPKPEPSTRESSVFCETRDKHSAKPSHYYEMLEKQYPDLPKRELFARSGARKGWLPSWGNQA
jgi:N6-adenosine-specific RNA methylase IME4